MSLSLSSGSCIHHLKMSRTKVQGSPLNQLECITHRQLLRKQLQCLACTAVLNSSVLRVHKMAQSEMTLENVTLHLCRSWELGLDPDPF